MSTVCQRRVTAWQREVGLVCLPFVCHLILSQGITFACIFPLGLKKKNAYSDKDLKLPSRASDRQTGKNTPYSYLTLRSQLIREKELPKSSFHPTSLSFKNMSPIPSSKRYCHLQNKSLVRHRVCNSSFPGSEAGRPLSLHGQAGLQRQFQANQKLHSETLS